MLQIRSICCHALHPLLMPVFPLPSFSRGSCLFGCLLVLPLFPAPVLPQLAYQPQLSFRSSTNQSITQAKHLSPTISYFPFFTLDFVDFFLLLMNFQFISTRQPARCISPPVYLPTLCSHIYLTAIQPPDHAHSPLHKDCSHHHPGFHFRRSAYTHHNIAKG